MGEFFAVSQHVFPLMRELQVAPAEIPSTKPSQQNLPDPAAVFISRLQRFGCCQQLVKPSRYNIVAKNF
eukprot:3350215-Amphidinium_carterae.1